MDSYFEKGVSLNGILWVKGAVHFDGDFEGEIYSTNHFVVGKSGKVLGNVKSHNLTNKGFIQGDLFAENKVVLMNDSRLMGDISTYHLIIDEGSNFEGRCKMNDAPPKTIKEEIETLERPGPATTTKAPKSSKGTSIPVVAGDSPKKKMAIAAVVLLVSGVLWFVFKNSKDDLRSLLDTGNKLVAENKYSDAESVFRKALKACDESM